jgi:hypothetical protein
MSSNANLAWNGAQSNGPAQSWSAGASGQPMGTGYANANGSMQQLANGASNYHHGQIQNGAPSGYQSNTSGPMSGNNPVGPYHPHSSLNQANLAGNNGAAPPMSGMSNAAYSSTGGPNSNGAAPPPQMHSQQMPPSAGQPMYGNGSSIMSKQAYQSMNGMPNQGTSGPGHVSQASVNVTMSNSSASTAVSSVPVSKPG